MGIFADKKAQAELKAAQEAMAGGRTVYLVKMGHDGANDLTKTALRIEAIESVGWRLVNMSFTRDVLDLATGFFLFRR